MCSTTMAWLDLGRAHGIPYRTVATQQQQEEEE